MGVPKLGLLLSQNFGLPYFFQIKYFLRIESQNFMALENIFPMMYNTFQLDLIWFLLSRGLWSEVKFPMWRHFKYLWFKTFLMVLWVSNLVFVFFFNQGSEHSQISHECNSQMGVHLGVIKFHPLQFPPLVRVCFHT
jgi:hypothetical protein